MPANTAPCGCKGRPRNTDGLPLSTACHDGVHGGCTRFSDGYETWHCGCSCHWCPTGLHLRNHQGQAS